jgi:hypothetical protein
MSCAEGQGLKLKFAILNAYYVPDTCKEFLYPDITPVNSFRIIYNCVFEANFPLLEDRSYYTGHPRFSSYEFIDVTNEVD